MSRRLLQERLALWRRSNEGDCIHSVFSFAYVSRECNLQSELLIFYIITCIPSGICAIVCLRMKRQAAMNERSAFSRLSSGLQLARQPRELARAHQAQLATGCSTPGAADTRGTWHQCGGTARACPALEIGDQAALTLASLLGAVGRHIVSLLTRPSRLPSTCSNRRWLKIRPPGMAVQVTSTRYRGKYQAQQCEKKWRTCTRSKFVCHSQ